MNNSASEFFFLRGLKFFNFKDNVFKFADIDCVFVLMIRKFLKNIHIQPIKMVRESIMAQLTSILLSYRMNVGLNFLNY